VTLAVHSRPVPLGGVDRRLRGVVGVGRESVLIGRTAARPAILGGLPDAASTESDVETMVRALVKHGSIAFDARRAAGAVARPYRAAAVGAAVPGPQGVTHAVKVVGGQRQLVRVRFACGCVRCVQP
jgi:hypothetical protein